MALGHGDPAVQSFDLRKGGISFALWLVLRGHCLGTKLCLCSRVWGSSQKQKAEDGQTEETLRSSLSPEILI